MVRRMEPLLLSGSVHRPLAEAIARVLGTQLGNAELERFPDGELAVRIDAVTRGRSVFLIQPLSMPSGESLLELLLLADAAHRAGAASVSAVISYLAYARQDRRRREGEPVGARVVADALATGRFR